MSKSNAAVAFKSTEEVKQVETANAATEAPVAEAAKQPEAKVYSEAVTTIVASTSQKSTKIRQLLAEGLKRGEVAKLLGIRYQHVRNVEITPIKKAA